MADKMVGDEDAARAAAADDVALVVRGGNLRACMLASIEAGA
jgi:hypothetical protein